MFTSSAWCAQVQIHYSPLVVVRYIILFTPFELLVPCILSHGSPQAVFKYNMLLTSLLRCAKVLIHYSPRQAIKHVMLFTSFAFVATYVRLALHRGWSLNILCCLQHLSSYHLATVLALRGRWSPNQLCSLVRQQHVLKYFVKCEYCLHQSSSYQPATDLTLRGGSSLNILCIGHYSRSRRESTMDIGTRNNDKLLNLTCLYIFVVGSVNLRSLPI